MNGGLIFQWSFQILISRLAATSTWRWLQMGHSGVCWLSIMVHPVLKLLLGSHTHQCSALTISSTWMSFKFVTVSHWATTMQSASTNLRPLLQRPELVQNCFGCRLLPTLSLCRRIIKVTLTVVSHCQTWIVMASSEDLIANSVIDLQSNIHYWQVDLCNSFCQGWLGLGLTVTDSKCGAAVHNFGTEVFQLRAQTSTALLFWS